MGTLIQMVRTSPENILFLYGFNEKGELVFKSSYMPKYLQHELISVDQERQMCYTNLYNFHIGFLERIKNNIIKM